MFNWIKSKIYNIIGLDNYLSLIRFFYLKSYNAGILRFVEVYNWHYIIQKIVQPGDYVIDMGANLGYFSKHFSDRIGANGKLFCVEPVEPYRNQLKKMLAGKQNFEIVPYALGESNIEKIELGIPSQFHNLGYIKHGVTTLLHNSEKNKSNANQYFESAMRKGSELFQSLPRLDYIKCDIEGYEKIVFVEMESIFSKYEPMVQVETWGENRVFIYDFFQKLNFSGYQILKNKTLQPLAGTPVESWGSNDLFFAPASRFDRIKNFLA